MPPTNTPPAPLGNGAGQDTPPGGAPLPAPPVAPVAPAANVAEFKAPKARNFERTRELTHDLFKLRVAVCRKNTSFKPGELKLEDAEHVHFFHSVDSHGTKQEIASPVGGHTHRVSITLDDKGGIIDAVCGPAIKQHEKRSPRGAVKNEWGPVDLGENKDGVEQFDAHVHAVEYVRSEKLQVTI